MNAKLSVKTGIELSIKKKRKKNNAFLYVFAPSTRLGKKKGIKVMRGRKRCDGYSDGTER